MPNNLSFVPLATDKAQELKGLCPNNMQEPWYKVIAKEDVPSIFPKPFRDKFDHAVVMGSGDAGGNVYLVVNAHRVDRKASAIDQEPFGIVFDNGNPGESGVFIHHGDWQGRTEGRVPPQFWQHVAASGIGNYYPPPSLPPNSTGALKDLATTSDLNAFNQSVKAMLNHL